MPTSRPALRLVDIVENIDRITEFTRGLDRRGFENDLKTALAVERCLQIISEAAIKLGDAAEELAPGPPWADIRGMGNLLRHGYDRVDPETLWRTIRKDLKPLRKACARALARLDSEA